MKRFIVRTLVFLVPIFIIPAIMIIADPFRIWFEYDDYYSGHQIGLNTDAICFKIYNKNKDREKFDSFIMGSSRSQAFKVQDWKSHVSESSSFHFSASGEGIYGILKKLEYLDEHKVSINNLLLILDESCLLYNKNKKGYLFITPPAFSKESKKEYYKTFLKASLDFDFMKAYFDYRFSKKLKPYMNRHISKLQLSGNYVNGDVWYDTYDASIAKDSVKYYSSLITQGVVYDRAKSKNKKYPRMSDIEKEQLRSIMKILQKHNTNYKIVISPLYDQNPMQKDRLLFLNNLFGRAHVYDYSGINQYTEPIGNFYERSHYRPHVAKSILEEIYHK